MARSGMRYALPRGDAALTSSRCRASISLVPLMSIASASTIVTKRQGVVGHVCAQHDWVRQANFAGQGTVMGIKREPQPTTYEGKAPDS